MNHKTIFIQLIILIIFLNSLPAETKKAYTSFSVGSQKYLIDDFVTIEDFDFENGPNTCFTYFTEFNNLKLPTIIKRLYLAFNIDKVFLLNREYSIRSPSSIGSVSAVIMQFTDQKTKPNKILYRTEEDIFGKLKFTSIDEEYVCGKFKANAYINLEVIKKNSWDHFGMKEYQISQGRFCLPRKNLNIEIVP